MRIDQYKTGKYTMIRDGAPHVEALFEVNKRCMTGSWKHKARQKLGADISELLRLEGEKDKFPSYELAPFNPIDRDYRTMLVESRRLAHNQPQVILPGIYPAGPEDETGVWNNAAG